MDSSIVLVLEELANELKNVHFLSAIQKQIKNIDPRQIIQRKWDWVWVVAPIAMFKIK